MARIGNTEKDQLIDDLFGPFDLDDRAEEILRKLTQADLFHLHAQLAKTLKAEYRRGVQSTSEEYQND